MLNSKMNSKQIDLKIRVIPLKVGETTECPTLNLPVANYKNFSVLKKYVAKKYGVEDQSEISLHYFEDDAFYEILDDESLKTFLRGYGRKKKTREILVLEEKLKARKLLQKFTVLRFCPVDKHRDIRTKKINELEEIGEIVINKKKREEKKRGIFFIVSCDEVKVEDEEKREELNNEIRRRNESKISFHNNVQADVELYEKIAELWGFSEFNIKKIRNPTRKQLLEYFDTYIDEDHSEEECFVFAFSGKGDIRDDKKNWIGDHIIVHDDEIVKIRDLVNKLKECKFPTKGPKIMFLDACRGHKHEHFCNVDEDTNKKDKIFLDVYKHVKDEETTTTNMENILLAFGTLPNHVAFTTVDDGSIFTRQLYREIIKTNRHSPVEFHQLLTRVNDGVAQSGFQMSCFRSSIAKELYFNTNIFNANQVRYEGDDKAAGEQTVNPMDKYQTKNGGLFVVIDLRNRITLSEKIKKDRKLFLEIAKIFKLKHFCYEQLENDEFKGSQKLDALKFLLLKIASYANENADEIDYLLLFVLAECENVESSTRFEFFDNNSHRMDISLSVILRPFFTIFCEGLRDKPRVVMIHAPEKYRTTLAKCKKPKRELFGYPTPNHADFYISISRPKEISENCNDESHFVLLLYSILDKFPEYEINQIVSVLQRETLKYNRENSEKINKILRNKVQLMRQVQLVQMQTWKINRKS